MMAAQCSTPQPTELMQKTRQLDCKTSITGHQRQANWTAAPDRLDTDASLDGNTKLHALTMAR